MSYYTLNFIDESLSNKEVNDIKSITDTLSSKERKLMNINGKHNPTGYKCFIEYDKSIPVSYFIIDKQKDDSGDVSFAVRSDYRSKGYAKKVISKGIKYINSHLEEFTEIYWATKPENIASQKLAEKYGFKLVRDDDKWKTYCKQGSKVINESILINEKDILYNKDKFDSGEINLCFIIGHSGSGKSTLGYKMAISDKSDKTDYTALDYILCIKDSFDTIDKIKNFSALAYEFFSTIGKKYYVTYDELVENKISGSEYEDKLFKEFIAYAITYAKKHKNKKFIIEGVWIFCTDEDKKPYFQPQEFKDYAFYIKGTSMIISKHRGAKRDSADAKSKIDRYKAYGKNFFIKNWKWYMIDEKAINKFRAYFKSLMKDQD